MLTMYYAGQDVGLTATPVDSSGMPLGDALSVAVTVTDPLGTVTNPAVASAASGSHTAVVSGVSVPGIWLYRWTASADSAEWASEGQFTVRPAGVEQLIDLASVKAYLNVPATDTRQDDELQGFILAAGDMARDVCGPFLPETHTEWFGGGLSTIFPDWVPLVKVLSVTEYYGLSAFALTEQDLGDQMDAFAFTVDYTTGEITRRTFGGEAAMFAMGYKNVKVVYTAGRGGAVPYTVRLGVLELIRHLWQLTQQGGRPRFGGAALEGEAAVPMGFALPSRVLELWAPFRRPPGIA